jgi:hypothetical protein
MLNIPMMGQSTAGHRRLWLRQQRRLVLEGSVVRAMSLAIFVPRGTKPYNRKGAIRRFRPGSI